MCARVRASDGAALPWAAGHDGGGGGSDGGMHNRVDGGGGAATVLLRLRDGCLEVLSARAVLRLPLRGCGVALGGRAAGAAGLAQLTITEGGGGDGGMHNRMEGGGGGGGVQGCAAHAFGAATEAEAVRWAAALAAAAAPA